MVTTMALALLLLVVLAILPAAIIWVLWRAQWRRLRTEAVRIQLKSGATIDGVIMSLTPSLITITAARIHTPKAEKPTVIDGQMTVPRSEIAWYQSGFDITW